MFLASNFTCYHKTSTSWQEGSRPCGGPCCVWYCGFSCGARASERRTWAIQVQLERDDDSSEREARTVTSPRLVTAAAAPGHRGRPTSSGPRMPLHPLAGAATTPLACIRLHHNTTLARTNTILCHDWIPCCYITFYGPTLLAVECFLWIGVN